MLRSSTKKGFMLIEVLCSLSLFYIMFTAALTTECSSINIRKNNADLKSYCIFFEALRDNMEYNASYDEISQLKSEEKLYIDSEKINLDSIKNSNLNTLFSNTVPDKEPYVKVSISEGDVLKVNISLCCKIFNSEQNLDCTFHKGRYKR
jgi:hypothetical protein